MTAPDRFMRARAFANRDWALDSPRSDAHNHRPAGVVLIGSAAWLDAFCGSWAMAAM